MKREHSLNGNEYNHLLSWIIFIQIYYVHIQPQVLDKKYSYILYGAELA